MGAATDMTPAGRIAIIAPHPDDPLAGGVERFCVLLAEALSDAGFDVATVGPSGRGKPWRRRLGLLPLDQASESARNAHDLSPDLVISNQYLGGAVRPSLRRIHVFHGNVPLHAIYGDLDMPLRERVRRIVAYGLAERRSVRSASVVAATSEANQDEVHRLYGVRRSVLIENAIDVELFRPRDRLAARSELGLDPSRRYALFAGRLEVRKGADLLEPACAAAGYELLVAGRDAPRHGTHLGLLHPERLAVAYGAADCVLFPTRYEACSFVVLEALASGVPLVTTEVAWMRSFVRRVPDYRRLLIEPNVQSIANRLRALSSEDQRELVQQASAYVRAQHELGTWSHAWVRLVHDVMDGFELRPY